MINSRAGSCAIHSCIIFNRRITDICGSRPPTANSNYFFG
nr:MAG TPA: 40S ribosomal protein S0-A [Caudoviricetes sp.]